MRTVLLNGQGDYCRDYHDKAYREVIPPGCFVMIVTPEQYELLKANKASMLADGKLYPPHL